MSYLVGVVVVFVFWWIVRVTIWAAESKGRHEILLAIVEGEDVKTLVVKEGRVFDEASMDFKLVICLVDFIAERMERWRRNKLRS